MTILKGRREKLILIALGVLCFTLLGLKLVLTIAVPRLARAFTSRFPRDPSTGVMIGAEAFSIKGGSTGCLLLHGFCGSPEEMRELGEFLASNGMTVIAPRLRGHGTLPRDLEEATFEGWLQDAEMAYEELKSHSARVYIVGFSLGGFLGTVLAREHSEEVHGIVLISTALRIFTEPSYSRRVGAYARIAGAFSPLIKKRDIADIHDLEAKARRRGYMYFPASAAIETLTACDRAREALPALAGKRFLLIDTTQDPDEKTARKAIAELTKMIPSEQQHVKRLQVTNSGHVIPVDYDKEAVFETVLDFIQQDTDVVPASSHRDNVPTG